MALNEEELRKRVLANTSDKDGRLEDQSLDLDARAMAIMGKRQLLRRNFGFTSLLSFSTTVLVSWEAFAITFQGGLVNGGSSTLVYGLILAIIGSLATAASLAEMASISPTSGGQYHWVAELAPSRYAIVFSWVAGWVSTFTRVAVAGSVAFLAGTMIQGLLVLNYETYVMERWQGTLLYWAVILVSVFVNIFGIRFFPYIETVALILHVVFFFALLIPLVHLAPQSSTDFVFRSFQNSGGWDNDAVSWCIGLLTSTYALSGVDGACHMSEEVTNAAVVVPRGMVWSIVISGTLCFGFSLAILFSIGDVTAALTTPTGFPIIEIFFNATQSYRATNAMVAALIAAMVFSTFGLIASASRLTWAFARDKGFPFPAYFAHVDRHYSIPIRAIVFITIVTLILGLINIGSTTAFNAMTSLALIGQYTSYVLPTILMVGRRMGSKHIPFGPWSLGRFGLAVNLVTIAFSALIIGFMVLPPYQPVTAVNMNYAGVVFGAVLIICAVLWFAIGRARYQGPLREVMENGNVQSAILSGAA